MTPPGQNTQGGVAQLVTIVGYVVGFSYPVLALSAGRRGVYQIFFARTSRTSWGRF